MRRSSGPRIGGGGAGGGMMKTVHRAVRAGIAGDATARTTGNRNQPLNTTLSLPPNANRPSSPCSYLNHDARAYTTSSPAASEEFDWEYIDGGGSDGDSVNGVYDDFVFGGVPSEHEVHYAVSSLHKVIQPASFAQLMKHQDTYRTDDDEPGVEKISSPTGFQKSGLELDWSEPSMQLCYSTSTLQSGKVFDAFHLLQTDPSVQRMVVSLSSDKAVWEAVMNNKVVREIRGEIQSISEGGGVDDSNPVKQVIGWLFANTKDKVIEIFEKITKVVNELIWPNSKPKRDAINVGLGSFDEKLRSSFFVSIVVLLIVVVSRSGKRLP